MNNIHLITRRSFIRNLGLASGGLIIACTVPSNSSKDKQKLRAFNGSTFEPNLFIQLKDNGALILVASRSEMGNGVRTSLTSVIADEMEADWTMVTVKQAPGDAKYMDQNTDGSRSVRTLFEPMRKMGATAKAMLIAAAAKKWDVDASTLTAKNHYIINPVTKDKLFYGDLVADAATMPVPENPPLKDPKDFNFIGSDLKSVDGKGFASGKPKYGMDIKLEGMKYVAIARCPVTFGTFTSYNKEEAIRVRGVEQVIEIPKINRPFGALGGVAVVATNTWAAIQGRDALKVEWDNGANESYSTDEYTKMIVDNVHKKGKEVQNIGNVNRAFTNADQVVESTFVMPHLVHAPMEVPNATADVRSDGTCEVWAPTQDPQTARTEVATFLGVDLAKVTINVTFLGGGFGRKSKPDFIIEAVAASKAINAPAQVVWTREDDIRHSYYHAVSAQYMKGALDKDGNVTGWLHRVAYPSITSTFAPDTGYAAGFEFGMGMTNQPYLLENILCENAKAPAHVRIGWYRSVINIIQGFSINVFVDELAVKAKKDPLEFRLNLLGPDRIVESPDGYNFDSAKLKHVLTTAAKNAGYGKPLPEGHAIGLAMHYSFLSYVASAVEVSVNNGKLKVHKITSVIDCGTAVNTSTIEAQMQGAAIFGMSLTMYGKITTKDGVIEQSNYHDYQVVRMNETPEIDVEIIKSTAKPTGVGEPGVPPIAPAIINGIFHATGKRYHSLPLKDHGLV
ncbi:molybdopterin-dependent oxidoreductase [Flavobacteriaceae bacterium F08102]|nr:molybdopterin-dependent oxidoreductase [Flavobacteriaceae bacterium F08102]